MSVDAFLGGRLRVHQPDSGYRAAMEPVFLAASVHPKAGQSVLDAGCGVGVASLCLAARAPDCTVTGIDIQPELLHLARRNSSENGFSERLHFIDGDILKPPPSIKQHRFDFIISNPPFYNIEAAPASPSPQRAQARTFDAANGLVTWLQALMTRLAPMGTLAVIHPAASLATLLATLSPTLGSLRIQPLQAFAGREAMLVIVTGIMGGKSPLHLGEALILHDKTQRFTAEAHAVLHNGKALAFARQSG